MTAMVLLKRLKHRPRPQLDPRTTLTNVSFGTGKRRKSVLGQVLGTLNKAKDKEPWASESKQGSALRRTDENGQPDAEKRAEDEVIWRDSERPDAVQEEDIIGVWFIYLFCGTPSACGNGQRERSPSSCLWFFAKL
ncbi:uncharacterized protein EI90DRAFT_3025021 [Cantharellus anzutake]|uniref:uncharacterized protein n=1 Tax=Cantharellus anzutake TaxID=1750568 RepID=UPI001906C4DD|nr:uncharacterized protein EI90DRAFT_3025021 [Cantharellus anzutake]KAF8309613.1 hypothetical protein EI90DRAFT_3025021 [Cantharellus anzutake]